MKMLSIGCLTGLLLIPGVKVGAVSELPQARETYQRTPPRTPGMMLRVISEEGIEQTVTLEGAGCTQSICSRVFLRGKAENGAVLQPLFHSIAFIDNTTADDALFVMRDGSQLRLKLVPDFRVLYITNRDGARVKLDLSKIRSLEFLDGGK